MLDLKLLFKRLLKNIWMLIAVPVVAAIAAYIFLEFSPKTYISTSKLSTGFTTNTQINVSNEQFRASDAWFKFDNLIAMIESEQILSMVSYDLLLNDLQSTDAFRYPDIKEAEFKTEAFRDSTIRVIAKKRQNFEILDTYHPFEKKIIDLLEEYKYSSWIIGEDISVKRENSSDYVAINYISENPHLSAFVVNALANEYIRYDSTKATKFSSRSIEFFSRLVTSKKEILDEKTRAIDVYKANNMLLGTGEDNHGSVRLLSLEEKRLETESDIQRLRISLADLNARITQAQNVDNNEKNATTAKIVELRERINSLNQQFIDAGSNDNELVLKIAEMRRLLREELEKYPSLSDDLEDGSLKSLDELIEERNQMKLDLEVATANLSTIESKLSSLKQGLTSSEIKSANLATLLLEKETASKEYLQAVEKYNNEKNKAMASFSNIQIIQKGQPNEYPESYHKRKIIVALAFMASLSICVFALTALEFFDSRIRTSSNFRRLSKLSLVGKINKEHGAKIRLQDILRANGKSDATNVELLRKIRYKIELSGLKTILFTSTQLGQGKSFSILSVAKSISLLNKRVLIIDTNFKNNAITKSLLGKGNQKMIEEHSSTLKMVHVENEPFDVRKELVSETINKNIDIIGNRLNDGSPSEIFAGRDFKQIIDVMKTHYDYVFLEGPALNEYSDTKELIQYVDGVVCVFSSEASIKGEDMESIDFLKHCDNNFIGSILNQTDPKLES